MAKETSEVPNPLWETSVSSEQISAHQCNLKGLYTLVIKYLIEEISYPFSDDQRSDNRQSIGYLASGLDNYNSQGNGHPYHAAELGRCAYQSVFLDAYCLKQERFSTKLVLLV